MFRKVVAADGAYYLDTLLHCKLQDELAKSGSAGGEQQPIARLQFTFMQHCPCGERVHEHLRPNFIANRWR